MPTTILNGKREERRRRREDKRRRLAHIYVSPLKKKRREVPRAIKHTAVSIAKRGGEEKENPCSRDQKLDPTLRISGQKKREEGDRGRIPTALFS